MQSFVPSARRYARTISFAWLLSIGSLISWAASQPAPSFARLPLAFEAARDASRFLARGPALSVDLGARGAHIHSGKSSGKTLDLQFGGAAANGHPKPLDLLPGTVNYFIGSDPRQWRTGIPTYGKVEYQNIYAGIDVLYYGNQDQLEYDFRVHAGAAPSSIRLVFAGAERVTIDKQGDLRIGDFRQHKPVAYQEREGGRVSVDCRYIVRGGREAGFALGAYDRSRPLIIDPVLSYSSYLGGSVNDGVTALRVDASGNIYMAGFTSSSNFPAKGAASASYAGSNSVIEQGQFGDAFVAKMNAAGTSLVYATYLGGGGDDFASGLAIDSAGNAYVAGNTQSSNFPVSAGALQKTYKGFAGSDDNGFYDPGDGFVAKLNAAGNQLVYATYLGGTLNDLVTGVAVDTNGNAAVVGATNSSDFPTTANALYPKFRGASSAGPSVAGDGFLSILNSAGTALTYSTFFGGSSHDGISAIAEDAQNNIYVCGVTYSSDFPVTAGAAQTVFKNASVNFDGFISTAGDAFVSKFSPQGALVYSTFLGGTKVDAATAIAVNSAGEAYVTGETQSTDFPVAAGAAQPSYKGSGAVGTVGDAYGGDAFATKLNAAGSAFLFSTYLGGAGDEAGLGIAVNAAGNAFVTGFTLSNDFPVTPDALQRTNAGYGGQGLAPNPEQGFDTERVRNTGDAFVTELSSTGSLVYSSFYGGSRDDAATSISLDAAGNPYIGGSTLSTTLAGSASGAQPAFGGTGTQWPRGDGFVAKFDFGGTIPAKPANVNIVAGFSGSGTALTALATPFIVAVVDATGAGVSGAQVTFSATNASVSPAAVVTDVKGRASTTVTLGAAAGSGSVTATVAGIPAATATLTISAAAAGPAVTAVVNGASFQTAISPGSWITVFTNVTASAGSTAGQVPLPTLLAGFRILVNGAAIPFYAVTSLLPSGTQLNAQLPYEVAAGSAQVVVEQNGIASAPYPVTVETSAPGIFVFGNNRAVAQNIAPDQTATVNTDTNPVPAGDFIIVYLTGQGPLDHAVPSGGLAGASPISVPTLPYSATLNGSPIAVGFLGMTPGQIGLAQANIQIPKDTNPGTYPIVIKIGSGTTNGPMISVTGPRQ